LGKSGSSGKSSSSGGSFDALNSSAGSASSPTTGSFSRAGSVGGGGASTASNWRKKSRDGLNSSGNAPRQHAASDDEAVIDDADRMDIDSTFVICD